MMSHPTVPNYTPIDPAMSMSNKRQASSSPRAQPPNKKSKDEPTYPRPPHTTEFAQWANNSMLSDVIIRYGSNGEGEFQGHRVVLATASSWFNAAFTNPGFLESDSPEITIEGDDHEACQSVLEACYAQNGDYKILAPWSEERLDLENVGDYHGRLFLYHIAVYTVADKYDVPRVREQASVRITDLLSHEINNQLFSPMSNFNQDFEMVIKKIYEATGHYSSAEPLRMALVEIIVSHPMTSPTSLPPGIMLPLVDELARSVPQFGCDIYLKMRSGITSGANKNVSLEGVRLVKCHRCDQVSKVPFSIHRIVCKCRTVIYDYP